MEGTRLPFYSQAKGHCLVKICTTEERNECPYQIFHFNYLLLSPVASFEVLLNAKRNCAASPAGAAWTNYCKWSNLVQLSNLRVRNYLNSVLRGAAESSSRWTKIVVEGTVCYSTLPATTVSGAKRTEASVQKCNFQGNPAHTIVYLYSSRFQNSLDEFR